VSARGEEFIHYLGVCVRKVRSRIPHPIGDRQRIVQTWWDQDVVQIPHPFHEFHSRSKRARCITAPVIPTVTKLAARLRKQQKEFQNQLEPPSPPHPRTVVLQVLMPETLRIDCSKVTLNSSTGNIHTVANILWWLRQ
jgi:hypothetical protein